MDFRVLLSPRSRSEMAAVDVAMQEFTALDDKAMAAGLVDLARRLIATDSFHPDQRYSYDEWALNRVIPELARRLDPELPLLPREIPQPDEASDPVTWLKGMTDERFTGCIRSILEHASYRRVAPGQFDLDRDLITGKINPIVVAASRVFPDAFAVPVQEIDTRPPFEGFQVITARKHRDSVLCHLTDQSRAERLLGHVIKVRESPDADSAKLAHQKLVAEFPRMDRRAHPDALRSVDILSFSVQSVDGEVLQLHEVTPAVPDPEQDPHLSEP